MVCRWESRWVGGCYMGVSLYGWSGEQPVPRVYLMLLNKGVTAFFTDLFQELLHLLIGLLQCNLLLPQLSLLNFFS